MGGFRYFCDFHNDLVLVCIQTRLQSNFILFRFIMVAKQPYMMLVFCEIVNA